MPAGDAHRVWFPQMIERLRSHWHDGISFEGLIELRDDLDGILGRIRSQRNIRSPIFRCPTCGATGPSAEPRVSVRALILTLGRFGIATKEQTRTLRPDPAVFAG